MSIQLHSSLFRATAALLAAGALAGCATVSTPRYDTQFGDAVRAARRAQTLYLQAPARQDPVLGIDGVSAVNAITHYQCPDATQPQTGVTINLGTGSGK